MPEQYIWSAEPHPAGEPGAKPEPSQPSPHYFRASFNVESVPQQATLYIAGPEKLEVYINGKLADKDEKNPASPLRMMVFSTDIDNLLQTGKNSVALKLSPSPDLGEDETYFVAKILPRSKGIDAPALLVTDGNWKYTQQPGSGWQNSQFDDSSWKPVRTFGPIESSLEFFQGNIDSGLYRWPGYIGASPFLAHTVLPAKTVQQVYSGRGSYSNLDVLTQSIAVRFRQRFHRSARLRNRAGDRSSQHSARLRQRN